MLLFFWTSTSLFYILIEIQKRVEHTVYFLLLHLAKHKAKYLMILKEKNARSGKHNTNRNYLQAVKRFLLPNDE